MSAATQRQLHALQQQQQKQEQRLQVKQELSDLYDSLGRDKTQLLEELVLLQSDDIGKLNIDEVLLRYFENHQQLSACDAWELDNQALRQMYSASVRVPRLRHFPGSARPKTGGVPVPRARSGHVRGATNFSARRRLPPDSGKMRRVLQPPHQRIQQLADHLVDSGDTYEGIERELAELTEKLVQRSLSSAVYNSAVHQLATRLVQRALHRASENLDARPDSSQLDTRQMQRVEGIAKGLASSCELPED